MVQGWEPAQVHHQLITSFCPLHRNMLENLIGGLFKSAVVFKDFNTASN